MRKMKMTLPSALFFLIGISTVSIAQVKKSDVEAMLAKAEITVDDIKTIWVANVQYIRDDRLQIKNDKFIDQKVQIKESGLLMYEGKRSTLFPYSSMKYIYVGDDTITITLSI